MNTIQKWKTGTLLDQPNPRRIIVTPEPNCNLSCEHCYFSHGKVQTGSEKIDWSSCIEFALGHDIPVFCAGRVVTDKVTHFVKSYLDVADELRKPSRLSLVDNGFTVFNLEQYFDRVEEFNISIDGRDAEHDIQRRRAGSARVAWESIYKLKKLGFDPMLASCISPITIPGWKEFEKEVEQADVPMSVGLTLEIEETRKPALYSTLTQRAAALEILVTGVPKLVQIYDLRDVKALEEVIGRVQWEEDDTVPGLTTTLENGVYIVYRPESILWNAEYIAHYDGKVLGHPRTNNTIEELLKKELCAWGLQQQTK